MLQQSTKSYQLLKQYHLNLLPIYVHNSFRHPNSNSQEIFFAKESSKTNFHTWARQMKSQKGETNGKNLGNVSESLSTESEKENEDCDTKLEESEPVITPENIIPLKRDESAWSGRFQQQQLHRSQKLYSALYSRDSGSGQRHPGASSNDNKVPGENTTSAKNLLDMANRTHKRSRLPSPKELKSYLDRYTIGQEKAKKHFSVAIYNHCVRLEDKLDRQEKEYAAMEFQTNQEGPSMDFFIFGFPLK